MGVGKGHGRSPWSDALDHLSSHVQPGEGGSAYALEAELVRPGHTDIIRLLLAGDDAFRQRWPPVRGLVIGIDYLDDALVALLTQFASRTQPGQ